MSYDSTERSNNDGKPIALYEFKLGYNYWRYSADEVDTPYGTGIVYKSVVISDGGVTMSGDATNDDVTITMPSTEPVPSMFIGTPPSDTIYVYMRRMHHGETEAPIVWVGEVVSSKRKDGLVSEVKCRTLTASFDRNGNRLTYGRQCPHALYDLNCRVNKALFAVTFQIQDLANGVVRSTSLSALPSGWFSNGFFEWDTFPGVKDRRGIENHSGAQFTVLGTLDGLEVGQYVTAYPGCPRTTAACVSKFNNLPNYGGFIHLPGKSPFDGDPVF